MAKRHARMRHHRVHHRPAHRRASQNENYLVIVRGWMLVVAFALMLGMGAMVGSFINTQLGGTPVVAGASTAR